MQPPVRVWVCSATRPGTEDEMEQKDVVRNFFDTIARDVPYETRYRRLHHRNRQRAHLQSGA